MTESNLRSTGSKKERLLFAKLALGVVWRNDFNTAFRGVSETNLATLCSPPVFGDPGDIDSFNAFASGDRAFRDDTAGGQEPFKDRADFSLFFTVIWSRWG